MYKIESCSLLRYPMLESLRALSPSFDLFLFLMDASLRIFYLSLWSGLRTAFSFPSQPCAFNLLKYCFALETSAISFLFSVGVPRKSLLEFFFPLSLFAMRERER